MARLPDEVFNDNIHKIVLAKPKANNLAPDMMQALGLSNRDYTRADIQISSGKCQLSTYTAKQVFHSNFPITELKPVLDGLFGVIFFQYHAWDGEYEFLATVSKKRKVLTTRKKAPSQPRQTAQNSFNRQKNYIINEGTPVPALVDMGIFTQEGKVAAAMRDKFGQINRFIELLADETRAISPETTVNIIDFGCGKSYLTFLVYHYFAQIRSLEVNICGLDLDAHVVQRCTAAAEKYGYKNLQFIQGDIGNQAAPPVEGWGSDGSFNIVISLHACDTATDHALFNAIQWNADLIYAVPCCQHELKKQMTPQTQKLFSRYGVIKERMASLATDAIRANILEVCGYKSQIIEFIDMEHTPKNLLIRARKRVGKGSATAWEEVEAIMGEFGFEPTLVQLAKTRFNAST